MAKHKTQLTFFSFFVNDSGFVIPLKYVEGVAPFVEVVPVPANSSRVFRGLSYVLGQLVTMIDIAPLINAGQSKKTTDVIVVKYNAAYYGIMVDRIGSIISQPEMQRASKTFGGFIISRVRAGSSSYDVIGVHSLIEKHILCS